MKETRKDRIARLMAIRDQIEANEKAIAASQARIEEHEMDISFVLSLLEEAAAGNPGPLRQFEATLDDEGYFIGVDDDDDDEVPEFWSPDEPEDPDDETGLF